MRIRMGFTAFALLLPWCPPKDNQFLGPSRSGVDVTGPTIDFLFPGQGPFNASTLSFKVVDEGPNATGVNQSSVQVPGLSVVNQGSDTYGADVAALSGPFNFLVNAADNAGNPSQLNRSLTFDHEPPVVNLTSMTPGANWVTTESSVAINLAGTIMDANPGNAVGYVNLAGPNGICGDADDVRATQGNGPGQVSQVAFQYAAAAFLINAILYRPLLGGQPVTTNYCFEIDASDAAQDETGQVTSPNRTRISFPSTGTWNPPATTDFALLVLACYIHIAAGLSQAGIDIEAALPPSAVGSFASLAGAPEFAGAAWSVQWSGPGVVGGTQRSGVLDANGKASDRQQINLFGTYTAQVSVTANGVTKSATGSVNVGPSQGTCAP